MPTMSAVQDLSEPNQVEKNIEQIDNELSKRFIALDPAGYFIIYIDSEQNLIYAKHFTNEVNAQGLAVDPETGKVIPAKGKVSREPSHIFQASTAKQLCVEIFETNPEITTMITMLDHAAYIGREAQKAEQALRHHQVYIQD
jgi:dihydropteroate synthase